MKRTRFLTKKPMMATSVKLPKEVAELLRAAALREETSQSQFLREAIRERAKRVLLEDIGAEGPHGS